MPGILYSCGIGLRSMAKSLYTSKTRTNRMLGCNCVSLLSMLALWSAVAAQPKPFPAPPEQALERTSFQTSQPWGPAGNLPADVAMVYGIGRNLPDRIQSWRGRGYRIHLMTGV